VAISFTCACGASLSVPDNLSGKNGWCPACGAILSVPVSDGKNEPTLRFRCPGCRRTLRVALRLAGTNGKCGSCGAVFTVGGDADRLRAALSEKHRRVLSDAGREEIVRVRCECGVTTARGSEPGSCPACGRALPEEDG
jgi:hypothetical protein